MAPAEERIAELLTPYLAGLQPPADLYRQCRQYLDLLLHWNARTNLTAVRDPEQLVRRQLGESLFAGRLLSDTTTLLDFGSGAGFPGIPLALLLPHLQVTLAESQRKKAAFLHEAVRTLGLSCRVWPSRVEDLPPTEQFDCVAMRAVDHSPAMLQVAAARVGKGGSLLRYMARDDMVAMAGWTIANEVSVPDAGRIVQLLRSADVPRGT